MDTKGFKTHEYHKKHFKIQTHFKINTTNMHKYLKLRGLLMVVMGLR
jgi:hypothetical protein